VTDIGVIVGREHMEEIMRIFASWSGDRSKAAALGLKSLLQDLFGTAVEIFVSEHINPGEAWSRRLGSELDKSEFGIICLTMENANAPWLLFEAGAIAKNFDTSRVVPYLVDELSSSLEAGSPLGQLQHVRADRDGTYRLIQSINDAIRPDPKSIQELERHFSKWWPDLEPTLKEIQTTNPAHTVHRPDRELLEAIWQRVEWLWRESSMNLPDAELKHMHNLSRRPTMTYARSGVLQKELRHLRDLGLIKNKKPIAELPPNFQLDEWLNLTDKGVQYLQQWRPATCFPPPSSPPRHHTPAVRARGSPVPAHLARGA
jgi:hypothetical protein